MSEEATITIGELAQLSGITPEAIRYYEREGVIPAAQRQGAGKYRRYGRADAERLQFVRRARDLGFNLVEVKGLLTLAANDPSAPCDDVDVMAKAHLASVEEKIEQLTALRIELTRLIVSCTGSSGVGDCSLLSALSGTGRLK